MFFCCSSSSLQEAPVGTALVFFHVTLEGITDADIVVLDEKNSEIKTKVRNGDTVVPMFLIPGRTYSIQEVRFGSNKLLLKKPATFKGAVPGVINYAMTIDVVRSGFMQRFKVYSSEEHYEKAKSKFNNRYRDYSKSKSFNRLVTENTVEKSKLIDF